MSTNKDDCWVAYKFRNDHKNIFIEGPFSDWSQASQQRRQIKIDVMSDFNIVVSNPFYAVSRKEAIEEVKKFHLWP